MKNLAMGMLLLGVVACGFGCGSETKQVAQDQPYVPLTAKPIVAKPEPPKVEPAPAEPQPAAEEKPAEKPVDDKGTTPARPSLLLGLMIQPTQLLMQSSMESVQGVMAPLSGMSGMPGMPGLGGGAAAPPEAAPPETKKPADQEPVAPPADDAK